MPENKNTVTSRIHGAEVGNPKKPVLVDTYRYHMAINDIDDAYKLVGVLVKDDDLTFVTNNTRPNMFLVYNPGEEDPNQNRKWIHMAYNEYVRILYGPYGQDYYIFGSGAIMYTLPDVVDYMSGSCTVRYVHSSGCG